MPLNFPGFQAKDFLTIVRISRGLVLTLVTLMSWYTTSLPPLFVPRMESSAQFGLERSVPHSAVGVRTQPSEEGRLQAVGLTCLAMRKITTAEPSFRSD